MHANQATINQLYEAFARLDPEAMSACYADNATFEDEAFLLSGRREVTGMWHMLCRAAQAGGRADWRLQWRDVVADEERRGWANWEAHYRFGATGRMVHNQVEARFTFDEQGRILTHLDRFNFWRWSWQAMGVPGGLLGWSPMFRTQVRKQALANLEKFLAQNPQLGSS